MRNVTLASSLLVLSACGSNADVPSPAPAEAPASPVPASPTPDVQPSGDFAFGAAPALRIRHGETQAIAIAVTRAQGAVGDVRVTLEGLPEGVHAEPATVGEGASQATLLVTADPSAKQILAPVTFVGTLGAAAHTQPAKLLVAGQPGELDTTFGVTGQADTTGAWSSILKRQPDGTVLVGGGVGPQAAVFRIDAMGKLDTSFGDQGFARVPVQAGTSDEIEGLFVTADGHIVASGYRKDNVTHKEKGLVLRFDAAGKLDTTFGTAGLTIIAPLGVEADLSGGIFEAANGALFFGGYDADAIGCRVLVVKLDANGAPDATFGTGGSKVIPAASAPDKDLCVSAGAAMPSGGFVLGATGYDTIQMGAVRFDAQGEIVTSWGTNGFTMAPGEGTGAWFSDLAVAPDGKVLLGGQTWQGQEMTFARVEADGKLDPTFGNAGVRTLDVGPMRSVVENVALAADGRVVAGGWVEMTKNGAQLGLVRLTPGGNLDTSFGTGGSAVLGAFSRSNGLVLGDDGRILVGSALGSPYTPTVVSVWQ